MKKVAIAYSTKDRVELTQQTVPALLQPSKFDLWWVDGSSTLLGQEEPERYNHGMHVVSGIHGGADAAIVWSLTHMLEAGYEIVGLCENDVLLHDGWFEATISLFERGLADGLSVGAVSPRAYEDRILLQNDGYAVMHNLGAGIVLFTREAAQLILANYRTGWWPHNRAVFAQLSGIDIGRYACFRGNEQWTTADWHWDAFLAQHGLASLALTPALCSMIGQEPSLEEQGLTLACEPVEARRDDLAFEVFKHRTAAIRSGVWKPNTITPIFAHQGTETIFAHQLGDAVRTGDWHLQWSQGFGGFAYRAEADAKLTTQIIGPVTFLVSGGKHGAKVTITDSESGYEIKPEIPAGEGQIAQIQVPGGMSYREVVLTCSAGAVFYGVQTSERQPITNQKFDYHSLPPV